MKTYILKKDTPKSKAGEKVMRIVADLGTSHHYHSKSGELFFKDTVENNPEWFEQIIGKGKQVDAINDVIEYLEKLKEHIKNDKIRVVDINCKYHRPFSDAVYQDSSFYKEYIPAKTSNLDLHVELEND